MKPFLSGKGKAVAIAAVLVPVLALLAYVATRSGPLAPVSVTVAEVRQQALAPALFGIGTVEAKALHKIGPTVAGRLLQLQVETGDAVKAGQLLGEMDPVDLDFRLDAQSAAVQRAQASVQAAEAQLVEASARKAYAASQAQRYEQLLAVQSSSEEQLALKRQEAQATAASAQAAQANLVAARQELVRLQAEHGALSRQRQSLKLVSPVNGIVTLRSADPGTTVVAGQQVVEVVESGALWIHTRFDQQQARGLKSGLDAQVALRSLGGQAVAARVARVEPRADAVTEEVLAKIEFQSDAWPPIGELAEVTVALPPQAERPVIPSASIQRVEGQLGVWLYRDGKQRFQPVQLGVASLDGQVQVLQGLQGGEQVIVYSEKALSANSRIQLVDRIVKPAPGAAK